VAPRDTSKQVKTKSWFTALVRAVSAIIIAVLAAAYTFGSVFGYVPAERKLDAMNIVFIILAIVLIFTVLKPEYVRRLKIFEAAGVKLELHEELKEVKEEQSSQAVKLKELADILPLLIPATEQEHLKYLSMGYTGTYSGNNYLRDELRHLRSIGLIAMVPGKEMKQLEDGKIVDLKDYVRLTNLGKEWVERLKMLEPAEAPKGPVTKA
jgi:predicted methyltransferase